MSDKSSVRDRVGRLANGVSRAEGAFDDWGAVSSGVVPGTAVRRAAVLEQPDPLDSSDELGADLDEDIQLPAGADRIRFDQDGVDDETLVECQPEYGDLIESGWIDRAARVEELDDDKGNPLDIGLTLDLNDSRADDELGQMIDIDVGSLLTHLPSEGETDRDAGASEAAFGVGALHELLLPHASDTETGEDERIDEEQFPAFDDAPVPSSSRTDSDETSDQEKD